MQGSKVWQGGGSHLGLPHQMQLPRLLCEEDAYIQTFMISALQCAALGADLCVWKDPLQASGDGVFS